MDNISTVFFLWKCISSVVYWYRSDRLGTTTANSVTRKSFTGETWSPDTFRHLMTRWKWSVSRFILEDLLLRKAHGIRDTETVRLDGMNLGVKNDYRKWLRQMPINCRMCKPGEKSRQQYFSLVQFDVHLKNATKPWPGKLTRWSKVATGNERRKSSIPVSPAVENWFCKSLTSWRTTLAVASIMKIKFSSITNTVFKLSTFFIFKIENAFWLEL